ncbi:hypothetical protein [Halomonas dongshanensis]|uniref:Uncharacterized protein n=1 Tax=Halomonas dongshanensis TaxID=2890835 RepID=A0ABT2EE59_9GAMM|nr:hypothetical protein [Halomonas dongshanensis]MCS2609866.1 hypothetical protein [Halomonas dongshanensis]
MGLVLPEGAGSGRALGANRCTKRPSASRSTSAAGMNAWRSTHDADAALGTCGRILCRDVGGPDMPAIPCAHTAV